jgi:hypothetical protein
MQTPTNYEKRGGIVKSPAPVSAVAQTSQVSVVAQTSQVQGEKSKWESSLINIISPNSGAILSLDVSRGLSLVFCLVLPIVMCVLHVLRHNRSSPGSRSKFSDKGLWITFILPILLQVLFSSGLLFYYLSGGARSVIFCVGIGVVSCLINWFLIYYGFHSGLTGTLFG